MSKFATLPKEFDVFLTRSWGAKRIKKWFEVNSPCSLTVKLGSSGFRKKNFIGEELMTPISIYSGKTGKAIIQFSIADEDDVVVEIDISEAMDKLTGFKEYFTALCDGYEDGIVASTRSDANAIEEDADMSARNIYKNPLYASW